MKELNLTVGQKVSHRLRTVKHCSVGNCENKYYASGCCEKHYSRLKRHGNPLFVKSFHGDDRNKHPLYTTYKLLKYRCLNPKSKDFKNYGGRGITICERWLGVTGFSNFCEDMGEKPTKKHSIDRMDNNKGYEKNNCRWATASEQNLNTRSCNKHPYVYFHNRGQKWMVRKRFEGKLKFFGNYATQTDAVAATIRLGFITK